MDDTGTNTTVKTRYSVLNEQILRDNPSFLVEGASSVKQRLKICGDAVTKMGTKAAKSALEEWGRPLEDVTHLVYVSSSEVRLPGGDLHLAVSLNLRKDINRVGPPNISKTTLTTCIRSKGQMTAVCHRQRQTIHSLLAFPLFSNIGAKKQRKNIINMAHIRLNSYVTLLSQLQIMMCEVSEGI